jgi:hypothetical protein
MNRSLPLGGGQGSESANKARRCRPSTADPQAAGHATREEEGAGAPAEPAEARRLHARLHHDAEEAELGAAQGRQGALTNGFEVIGYIPGEGHKLQEHSVVMIRGGRVKDLPACATTSCAACSTPRREEPQAARSKYGAKRPK